MSTVFELDTGVTTLFTQAQQKAIEALRSDLARRVQRKVNTIYGNTDNGQHWALFDVDSLPAGCWEQPGPLVSLLVGTGVPGPASVMDADGRTVVDGAEFSDAVKTARTAGVKRYRFLKQGAYAG